MFAILFDVSYINNSVHIVEGLSQLHFLPVKKGFFILCVPLDKKF